MQTPHSPWRTWLLGLVTAAAIAAAFSLTPIPQDPAYHRFADRRTVLGIANFWPVISSLPFLAVGLYGLRRLPPTALRRDCRLFCLGVAGVGPGSAWYHLNPTTATLAWDRLPMSVAFMALLALVIRDRLSPRLGGRLLWPLVLAGLGAVGYWQWSELQGRGDLRAYAVVQFLPMLLLPLLLILCREQELRTPWLWGTAGGYALAKAAEHCDQLLLTATGSVSGHTLKHLLGALAAMCVVRAFAPAARTARPAGAPPG